MSITDAERQAALKELERGYFELTSVLDSLSEADMLRPDTVGHWNGRDVLSHIAAWEVEGRRHMNALDEGEVDSFPDPSEFDSWNEQQVIKTREWSVDQVRAFFESAHQEFILMVKSSGKVSPGFATGLTSHHYEEHINQFRAMQTSAN